jgi:hypothetical protein
MGVMKLHGPFAEQSKIVGKEIFTSDAKRLSQLLQIIQIIGWPKICDVGENAARAAFLILQHGDHDTRKMLFQHFKIAVESGNARKSDFAMLEDRILVADGNKQKYGTQFSRGQDGKPVLVPIEDPDNIDARRASMGLGPLNENVKRILDSFA